MNMRAAARFAEAFVEKPWCIGELAIIGLPGWPTDLEGIRSFANRLMWRAWDERLYLFPPMPELGTADMIDWLEAHHYDCPGFSVRLRALAANDL